MQGKDKTQSWKLNDKKTSEKFNNCINKETKNVQIIVLVDMKKCVKVRSKMFRRCIDRNELILENLRSVKWLLNRKYNVPIFVLVGVSHRLTQSTKVQVDREGEMPALKKWNVGGWGFSGHAASIKSHSKKVKMSWCDVECCRRRGRCSNVCMCILLRLDHERISSYIALPSSNRLLLSLSLFFTANVIDWSKNYV